MDVKPKEFIEPVERLELAVIDERAATIAAQMDALLYKSGLPQAREANARDRVAFQARIEEKYALKPGDQVDGQTGEITRKEAPLKAV